MNTHWWQLFPGNAEGASCQNCGIIRYPEDFDSGKPIPECRKQ